MNRRSRQQRADALAAHLRIPSYEEAARMGRVLLPHVVVSLVLQCVLLVVGVRTLRQLYQARHLGGRPLLRVAANGPVVGLAVLNLAHWMFFRRLARSVTPVSDRARLADDA